MVLNQVSNIIRFEFGVELYVRATILTNELKYVLILDAHICFFRVLATDETKYIITLK